MFYFERCENNSNVNTVIYFEQFLEFATKYDGWESNIGYSLKCHTPLPLLANVVYKFKCLRDANNIYIGKTIRHLATRLREHGTSHSAVSNHLSSCEICKLNFSCDSFSIIDSGKNDFEITVKEALHIKFKKPTTNRQLFTQGSSFVLNVF